MTKRVCVLPGDDAAPEAMLPVVSVLRGMELDLSFEVLPSGADGMAQFGDDWDATCKRAIDATETTLFGSTSGKTPALPYLRWGRGTYANVRPVQYLEGARTPLKDATGIDFVIVRENSEDLYAGIEGDLDRLEPLGFRSRLTGNALPASGGRFAIKVITEAASRRIVEFAFALARQRAETRGRPGRVTLACKHNMLPRTDGLFRAIGREVAASHPEVEFEDFIVDDFACRLVTEPRRLDVVVLPNLYGDILSDEAAGLVGGLGMSPSGCYGDGFAYFEPVHGTAPDIAGTGMINPTATFLSAAMMLDYLELRSDGDRLREAVKRVYREGRWLTRDQGGRATAKEFSEAVANAL